MTDKKPSEDVKRERRREMLRNRSGKASRRQDRMKKVKAQREVVGYTQPWTQEIGSLDPTGGSVTKGVCSDKGPLSSEGGKTVDEERGFSY